MQLTVLGSGLDNMFQYGLNCVLTYITRFYSMNCVQAVLILLQCSAFNCVARSVKRRTNSPISSTKIRTALSPVKVNSCSQDDAVEADALLR